MSEDEVTRTRVSDQLVSLLREAVLSGDLQPGAPLREVGLADRFGVSRGTVREAIRALEVEGLAAVSMHRGASVVQPTADDVVDVYRARLGLETAAARAVTTAPVESLLQLQAPVDEMEAAVARGDWRAAVTSDLAFHARVVGLLGSARLDAFYAHLQGELRLLLVVADRDAPERNKVELHRRYAELALARDAEGLQVALTAHIETAQRSLVALITRAGG